MKLDALEFIRRFAMHILPKGFFLGIRHYGILSSTSKSVNARVFKDQLPLLPKVVNTKERLEIFNPKKCPCCKKETMLTVQQFARRGPPSPDWEDEARKILDCLT